MKKRKLLGTNFKLQKKNNRRFLVTGLSLAPNNIGGTEVCSHKTPACVASCVLWFTGRTVMPEVRQAMIARKQWLANDPIGFTDKLCKEIDRFIYYANRSKLRPALRLNVASDLDWSHVIRNFPNVHAYDYTKVRSRLIDKSWPTNYQLTYSLNEHSHHSTVLGQLDRGGNVAAVFSTRYNASHHIYGKLPDEFLIHGRTFPVIDGDEHDVRLREMDGSGVIVGLRFKGSLKRRAYAIKHGFCFDVGDGV